MLTWAHQDPAAQLQLARETLALASALKSTRGAIGSQVVRDLVEI